MASPWEECILLGIYRPPRGIEILRGVTPLVASGVLSAVMSMSNWYSSGRGRRHSAGLGGGEVIVRKVETGQLAGDRARGLQGRGTAYANTGPSPCRCERQNRGGR